MKETVKVYGLHGKVEYREMEIPEEPEVPVEPSEDDQPVTWKALDEAYSAGYHEGYQEGVNAAYEQ